MEGKGRVQALNRRSSAAFRRACPRLGEEEDVCAHARHLPPVQERVWHVSAEPSGLKVP